MVLDEEFAPLDPLIGAPGNPAVAIRERVTGRPPDQQRDGLASARAELAPGIAGRPARAEIMLIGPLLLEPGERDWRGPAPGERDRRRRQRGGGGLGKGSVPPCIGESKTRLGFSPNFKPCHPMSCLPETFGPAQNRRAHLSFLHGTGFPVPAQRANDNSPALECWVHGSAEPSPGRDDRNLAAPPAVVPAGTGRFIDRPPSTQVLGYFRPSLRDCANAHRSLQKTELRPKPPRPQNKTGLCPPFPVPTVLSRNEKYM